MYYKKNICKSALAVILCATLALSGNMQPLPVHASVGDGDYGDAETTESTETESTEDDVYESDDTSADIEEPTTTANDELTKSIQDKIDQTSSNLANIKSEQKKIEQSIAGAKSEKEKAEIVRNNFGYQITLRKETIATLENRIALLEEDISQKKLEIEEKQDTIDYNYDLFKKRIRAKYMQDNGSVLGLLLGSDSFSDFLTRTEYMTRVSQHDRDLMEELTEERIVIENDKIELEETKALTEEDRLEVESQRQELAVQYQDAANEVFSIEQMEKEYMADLAKNKAMQDQMKSQMDKLYRELEFAKFAYAGGEMQWPLPGFSTLSSTYGSRFGGSDFHTGTDITGSGCFGASIVAANDGVVKFVNTSYSNGVGYGIYVILDHGVNENGKSVSTLYAHCSAITVSVGQTVKRGQEIAKVGSTGWSTGPHLHFEVRLDGSHVNSLPYIQG